MIRTSLIPSGAAARAVAAGCLLALSLPLLAHEGHDHGAVAQPADVRLAPRFEIRSDELEMVGVAAGKELIVYLDRAADNAPIPGAQLEIEGPGIKGVATETADGVYRLAAPPLAQAGRYPLTITVQAGEIVDLFSAQLAIGEVAAAVTDSERPARHRWFYAGLALLLAGALLIYRRRRQPQ